MLYSRSCIATAGIMGVNVVEESNVVGRDEVEEWEKEEEERSNRLQVDQYSLLTEFENMGSIVWTEWDQLILRDPTSKRFESNYRSALESASRWHMWATEHLIGQWLRRGYEYVADFDSAVLRYRRTRPEICHLQEPPLRTYMNDYGGITEQIGTNTYDKKNNMGATAMDVFSADSAAVEEKVGHGVVELREVPQSTAVGNTTMLEVKVCGGDCVQTWPEQTRYTATRC